MAEISDQQRRWRLAHRHRLTAAGFTDDVANIASSVVALHSSDPATVFLSALARMQTPSIDAVERALYDERSVVRHHAMRRTIWVMPRRTARVAHAATTAKIAANERRLNIRAIAASGIDSAEEWLDAASQEIAGLVRSSRSINTRQLGKALPHLSLPLQYGGGANTATLNAHTKVLQGAGFEAVLVRGKPSGSWISSEYPWSLTEDWLGEPIVGLEKRPAAAELVELWLRQFGPATETDMVWWFGDTKTLIRNALADIGAESVLLEDGDAAWVASGDTGDVDDPGPWVRLLPGLDATSMGWKERDFYIDPEYCHPLFDQFGNIGPAIWVDGRIVGGWIQRPDGSIVTELFEPITASHETLLAEAILQLEAVLDDVAIRPRFPARMQKRLLSA